MNPPSPEPVGDLADLLASETDAVLQRRRAAYALGDDEDDTRLGLPRVGLALSGGGIRSATYCLGLLRGLAQRGLLPRIDFLSTVSGGGFTGGMFGRLVMLLGIQGAQGALQAGDSMLLAWLRRNGRYLTPAGSRDLGMALATYLRAWLAIEIEFSAVCLVFGAAVILPHATQQDLALLAPQPWAAWVTPWWPVALAVWLLLAPGMMAGYWVARDPSAGQATRIDRGDLVVFGLLSAAAAGTLVAAWNGGVPSPLRVGPTWAFAVFLVVWSVVLGEGASLWLLRRGRDAASVRNLLTRGLRAATLLAGAVFLVGLFDALSWQTLLWALSAGGGAAWSGVGVGAVLVALRTFAEPLQKQAQAGSASSGAAWRQRMLNLLGHASVILLIVCWLTLIQWFVFDLGAFPDWSDPSAVHRLLAAAAVGAAWLLLTMGNRDMPNASSLHGFYRARLTRAYLSVGNPARFGGAEDAIARVATPESLAAVQGVTDVVAGDEMALADYRPESRGGPLHLINCCLNQTRDDASGLYNADRKGLMLSVNARGVELGPGRWLPGDPGGMLGRWVAISGAAAAPGAGASTTRGMALLLYFLGVRLGYWLPALAAAPGARWSWAVSAKLCMLVAEALARFRGAVAPWWYLSDGGHFDNTGVYALLKRRLDFIILADCGADPGYQFGDVENLVRKARIDFSADIDFYTRADALRLFDGQPGALEVLSPSQMADHTTSRGVMLARIRYVDGSQGTLLVVKPALHTALDVDLLAYAERSRDFPQQATSDQFFDEAQWESYHRLGEDLALRLTPEWLAQVPGWQSTALHDHATPAELKATSAAPADPADDPLAWRRSARAAAVGASIGLGAVGTVLVGAWQALDQLRQAHQGEQQAASTAFDTASKDFGALNLACTRVPEHVMAHVSELAALTRSHQLDGVDGANASRLLSRIRNQCTQALAALGGSDTSPVPGCAQQLGHDDLSANIEGLCAEPPRGSGTDGALDYWLHARTVESASGGALPADARAAATAPPAPPAPPPVMSAPIVLGSSAPAPASAAVPAPVPAVASAPPPSPSPLVASWARVCGSASDRVWIYTQVYDDASRDRAERWRARLSDESRSRLLMAPIEDVTRTAELRQTRKPIPWRAPTLIVQDPADRACAQAVAAHITDGLRRAAQVAQAANGGADPMVQSTEGASTDGADNATTVAVRDLPANLSGRRHVMELWWPPSAVDADGP